MLPRLLDVRVDEFDDAVDEREGEPLLHRVLAPGEIELLLLPAPLHGVGKLHHPLGRVRAAIEDDVLDVLEQVLRDVFVDDQLPGIDDPHVHAGLDGVVEERRVDRLADDIVAAERERQVADAAADLHAGTGRLDDPRRLDEVDRVVVVLLEPGRNREDVRIEDDVGRIEADLLDEQLVGALADLHLALDGIGLARPRRTPSPPRRRRSAGRSAPSGGSPPPLPSG